ncbi:hypothetical protein H0W91_00005 [Patescibacteria group bacterium]|nr:hypothetical protein [Patescibacteria group bacterium]
MSCISNKNYHQMTKFGRKMVLLFSVLAGVSVSFGAKGTAVGCIGFLLGFIADEICTTIKVCTAFRSNK